MDFTPGSKVEVRSDEEGFKGAYYLATILEEPKSEQCVVVYDQLTESEDPNSKYLTEMVHISQLRPLPPLNKGEIIKIHDTVDAYYNDGWWPGEVVETLQDGKFLVYFIDPPDQQLVERNNLRHHSEWVNGKWETPRKKDQLYVEVTFERENYKAWHLGNVLQVEGNNNFLVKYQCLGVDNKPAYIREIVDFRCIRPFPPHLAKQDFVVLDKVDVYHNLSWWKGVIHKILNDMRCVVVTQTNVEFVCNRSYLRPQLDWIDGKWTTTSPNTKVLANYNEPSKCKRTKTLGQKLQAGKYCGALGKKSDDAARLVEPHMHVHEELVTSSETPVKKNRKRQIRDQYKESIEGSTGIKRTRNRKRGRPQMLSIENQIGNDSLLLTTVDNHEPIESLSDAHPEMIPKTYLAEDQMGKEWLIEWHGETSQTVDVESQNQGVLPLYQCTNATYGENDNDASSAFATTDIVQFSPIQKTVANHPGCELGTPSAIVSYDGRDSNENVPFIKSSPLWKSLDSMEIFSKTQRKPHFNPLLKCREETREGLAIAHMVTFSTVIEKTSKSRFSDPSSVIIDNLKTLAELEKHGFDVEPVRARLRMLLATKEKERKLQADYKMIENEITNNVLEKDKLSQEIIQINRTIKELAEKLTEIDSKMLRKDKEISTLRSRQEAIRENMHGIEHEFETTMK
ncbi:hypothetical protein POM88_051162 [Heracleum sosnowskyi]|uniref:Agenet domain-containing protein n=1 Tax=Heracleum sosnowskyi TaxID=360622 RepID=A0AAD8H012_9APIA|nr:hypothetical protein POM88_051162 [Heracleum sosnowskyi]